MARKLVMVMGAQRSGTNALFCSLANDKQVIPFNESIDNAIYCNYLLRPLGEIAGVLGAATGTVLLKPISETKYRTIDDVIREYHGYALQIVWIYRDPVNVFYSMHREGWIPFNEIGSEHTVEHWNKRNRLAYESCRRYSDLTAIVRYEDLLVDRRVFRQLCNWLRTQSRSSFSADSGRGRRRVPLAAQHRIDERTIEVLHALDAARTFRPRRMPRLRHSFAQKLGVTGKKIRRAIDSAHFGQGRREWDNLSAVGPRSMPSEIAGLRFWLDCPENLQKTGKLTNEVHEKGPCHMSVASLVDGLYYLSPCINGRPAFFFPAEKIETRREAPYGILEFSVENDWSFMFNGSPFAVFAVFKPNVPATVLLRVGPASRPAPAFVLRWNSDSNASEGILIGDSTSGDRIEQRVASTPPGSHPLDQWRIIDVRHTGDEEGTLLCFANGAAGVPLRKNDRQERSKESFPSVLQLGGTESGNVSLFFGAVAEVIIFDDSLDDQQRIEITGYLKEKYQL